MSVADATVPVYFKPKTLVTSICTWLLILRIILLACLTGVTQSALDVIYTVELRAAAAIVLMCLMASILALPTTMLAEMNNLSLGKFLSIQEITVTLLMLSAGVLCALQIYLSHQVAKAGLVPHSTFLELMGATGLGMATFVISSAIFIISVHRVGRFSPVPSDSEKCLSSLDEKRPVDAHFTTDDAQWHPNWANGPARRTRSSPSSPVPSAPGSAAPSLVPVSLRSTPPASAGMHRSGAIDQSSVNRSIHSSRSSMQFHFGTLT